MFRIRGLYEFRWYLNSACLVQFRVTSCTRTNVREIRRMVDYETEDLERNLHLHWQLRRLSGESSLAWSVLATYINIREGLVIRFGVRKWDEL